MGAKEPELDLEPRSRKYGSQPALKPAPELIAKWPTKTHALPHGMKRRRRHDSLMMDTSVVNDNCLPPNLEEQCRRRRIDALAME